MKSTTLLAAALFALATVFTVPAAEAATKPDFSELTGRYKGTGTVVIGSTSGIGRVNLNVRVPRNGRSAEIAINGTLIAGGTALPVFGRIRMKGRRSFTVDSLVFNVLPAPSAQGTFKALRNRTTFSAPWAFETSTGTILGNLSLSPNGRRIQLVYTLTVDGADPFFFTFNANRKGK